MLTFAHACMHMYVCLTHTHTHTHTHQHRETTLRLDTDTRFQSSHLCILSVHVFKGIYRKGHPFFPCLQGLAVQRVCGPYLLFRSSTGSILPQFSQGLIHVSVRTYEYDSVIDVHGSPTLQYISSRIHVCMSVCMHVHTHVHISACACMHAHICNTKAYAYMCVCLYACKYTHLLTCAHVHVHAAQKCMYTCVHVYVCLYVCTYTHMLTYAHVYVHTCACVCTCAYMLCTSARIYVCMRVCLHV
jgi:hypothetical protein